MPLLNIWDTRFPLSSTTLWPFWSEVDHLVQMLLEFSSNKIWRRCNFPVLPKWSFSSHQDSTPSSWWKKLLQTTKLKAPPLPLIIETLYSPSIIPPKTDLPKFLGIMFFQPLFLNNVFAPLLDMIFKPWRTYPHTHPRFTKISNIFNLESLPLIYWPLRYRISKGWEYRPWILFPQHLLHQISEWVFSQGSLIRFLIVPLNYLSTHILQTHIPPFSVIAFVMLLEAFQFLENTSSSFFS